MTTKEPREFYKFSGTYHVSPDTSSEHMASDAACLLDSAEAMVNALIDGFGQDFPIQDQSMVFGIRHFVTMAKNLCQEIQTDLQSSRHAAEVAA